MLAFIAIFAFTSCEKNSLNLPESTTLTVVNESKELASIRFDGDVKASVYGGEKYQIPIQGEMLKYPIHIYIQMVDETELWKWNVVATYNWNSFVFSPQYKYKLTITSNNALLVRY